jgi:hypothetical protein
MTTRSWSVIGGVGRMASDHGHNSAQQAEATHPVRHGQWAHVSFRWASAADLAVGYDTFDYTKLSAINTCPVWGILRYAHHKTLSGTGRAMALEGGKLMHECFSVVRCVQLHITQGMPEHAELKLAELFSPERADAIIAAIRASGPDAAQAGRNAALECLHTGEWVDDPFDTRRTLTNYETSLLYYTQRWDYSRYPVWVRSNNDPLAGCGIEIPFGFVVTATRADGTERTFIYTGRIDGLHTDNGSMQVQENKTAARLNDAWSMSFEMSHQPTGYCVAASLFTEQPCDRAHIIGLQTPLPRVMSDGLAIVPVNRPDFMKQRWLQWLETTIEVHDRWRNNILEAPQYTHSCNRYFRPCSFIPYCTADDDERKLILSEMVTEEWSPLAQENTP